MDSDALERAEAAWQAGSDELDRVGKIVAHLTDTATLLRPWPTEELAKGLGVLRDLIAQAKAANSAELGMAETAIEAQIDTVAAHSRDLRALREKYEARWGKGV